MTHHSMNMYVKLAMSINLRTSGQSSFIRRLPQLNRYRHKISATGGFDTASCEIPLSISEGEQVLEQWLGNRVLIFGQDAGNPIWEGFINRMTFDTGLVSHTVSLDTMINAVATNYTAASGATRTTNAVTNENDSQAIYGIKHGTLNAGQQHGNQADNLRDTTLANQAWPQVSTIARGGKPGLMQIEMLGFYHTLFWDRHQDTTSANITVQVFLETHILPNLANGTTFFDNTDFSQIAVQAGNTQRLSRTGNTAWQAMQKIQEAGDGTNRIVMGIEADPISIRGVPNSRHFYYRAANTAIEYTARTADGLRIRDLNGTIIPPSEVRPDRGIRINDLLPGWNLKGDNPTETYIEVIEYDADRQVVTWHGADDLRTEAAFQLRQQSLVHGTRFGAIQATGDV